MLYFSVTTNVSVVLVNDKYISYIPSLAVRPTERRWSPFP